MKGFVRLFAIFMMLFCCVVGTAGRVRGANGVVFADPTSFRSRRRSASPR